MRSFELHRTDRPSSGVAGEHRVAQGVEFDDGLVVVQWTLAGAVVTLAGVDDLPREVAGYGGRLQLTWLDDPSPDCAAGKHRACDGAAWSLQHDVAQPCPCRCHRAEATS